MGFEINFGTQCAVTPNYIPISLKQERSRYLAHLLEIDQDQVFAAQI